jgi:alkylhydroperoxidase/carboxymuconolactone decarboxylase family protein YurZ
VSAARARPHPRRQEKKVADSETPVLDTIGAMTLVSMENSDLEADELVLVRLAALAAVDAPALSYLAHIGPAVESGVTLERAQAVLAAVAPVIGTAKTMSAALKITEALGFAIAVAEAELMAALEADLEAEQ